MFESGALSGKMFLVRIIKSKKLMLILGQVRLSKGIFASKGQEKEKDKDRAVKDVKVLAFQEMNLV